MTFKNEHNKNSILNQRSIKGKQLEEFFYCCDYNCELHFFPGESCLAAVVF